MKLIHLVNQKREPLSLKWLSSAFPDLFAVLRCRTLPIDTSKYDTSGLNIKSQVKGAKK
jgi:hypothetical protein